MSYKNYPISPYQFRDIFRAYSNNETLKPGIKYVMEELFGKYWIAEIVDENKINRRK